MSSLTDAERLEKLKNGYVPRSGVDAKLAAIHKEGMIITTPNASYIPSPLFGIREVVLRSDLRYGVDDATVWPQFHMEKYPHLAAIPLKVTDPINYLSSIWWTPLRGDFKQSSSSGLSGLGTIVCREMEALEHCKRDIMYDAHEYLKQHPQDAVVLAARSATAFSWVRLSTLLGKYEEKSLEVSEFQRNWLDLRASLDYLQIYFPRMYSNDGYASVEPRIGCFTTQPIVAQEFYAAGIPVWLIRSLDSIGPEIGITKTCSISEPPHDIRMDLRPNENYPIIYRGRADHPLHYIEQHKFTRSRMLYFHPSGYRVSMPSGDELGSLQPESHTRSLASLKNTRTTEVSIHRTQPYDISQRPVVKKQKGTSGRNKFDEIDNTSFPSPITAWAAALRDVPKLVSEELRAKILFEAYTVPDPGLFCTAMQKNKYLENWLRSRESWIWRIVGASDINGGSSRNYYVPTKVWRDLLFLGFRDAEALSTDVSTSQTPSTSSPTVSTKVKNNPTSRNIQKQQPKPVRVKRQEKLLSVKDVLWGGHDSLAPVQEAQQLMWQKVPVQIENGLPHFEHIEKEILWELYEINFRYDLMMLDSKLAPSKWSTSVDGSPDALDRVMKISLCFVGGDTLEFTLLPPSIPTGNVGLAADKMSDCRPYIVALARLMLDWNIAVDAVGDIQKLIDEEDKDKLSDVKVYKLSRAVADVYCAGVYIVLGRAAITPHRMNKPVR